MRMTVPALIVALCQAQYRQCGRALVWLYGVCAETAKQGVPALAESSLGERSCGQTITK